MVAIVSTLPSWVRLNKFFAKDLTKHDNPMTEVAPTAANLVSSVHHEGPDGVIHTPVLDIDMPVKVLPSTTGGHHHLFIDKQLTVSEYDKLLRVLVEVGIVQKGVLELQWERDGHTAVRMPHVKKVKAESSSGQTKADVSSSGIKNVAPTPDPNPPFVKVEGDSPLAEWEKELLGGTNPKEEIPQNSIKTNSISPKSVINNASIASGWVNVGYTTDTGLTKFEGLPDLTSPQDDAMILFKHLADVAKQTGETLQKVIGDWETFISKMQAISDDQNEPKPGNTAKPALGPNPFA